MSLRVLRCVILSAAKNLHVSLRINSAKQSHEIAASLALPGREDFLIRIRYTGRPRNDYFVLSFTVVSCDAGDRSAGFTSFR